MKKMICLLALLLVVQAAHADSIISVEYTIYKNGTADIISTSVTEGAMSMPDSTSEEYKLRVLDFEGKKIFDKNMLVMFNIPEVGETNESYGQLKLPFEPSATKVQFLHNGTKIADIDLTQYICNKNGACAGYENKMNCPTDCEEKGLSFWIYVIALLVVLLVLWLVFRWYQNRQASGQSKTDKWKNIYNS